MEFIVEVDEIRGPEVSSDEIDPVGKRGEFETEVTRWKRGRCGQICRGICPLDAHDQ